MARRLLGLALLTACGCALSAKDLGQYAILPEARTLEHREPAADLPPNPPPTLPPRTVSAPRPDALEAIKGQAREEIRLCAREIYVHYPDGIGRSKLRIPSAADGTARNMNTVAKLAAMTAE